MAISLFNDVIGPIMRGPSSGHTAATWRMGNMTLQLLGETPTHVECRFHKSGSYANVFRQQRSDLAFVAGLMDFSMEDTRYDNAFAEAKNAAIDLLFTTPELANADHPNEVEVFAQGTNNNNITVRYKSIGGGIASLNSFNSMPLLYTGNTHALFIIIENTSQDGNETCLHTMQEYVNAIGATLVMQKSPRPENMPYQATQTLVSLYSPSPFSNDFIDGFMEILHKEFISKRAIHNTKHTTNNNFTVRRIKPLMYCVHETEINKKTEQTFFQNLFESPHKIPVSITEFAQNYETSLLMISQDEAKTYLAKCLSVMDNCVQLGMGLSEPSCMRLLKPVASILGMQKENMLLGGIHIDIALRAMAAAEWNASGGLIVAAPTAGSGAILPATLATLKELGMSEESRVRALWAAGVIGLAIAHEYTFAGGVGGCQVEIGAAGAMASAAIVEATLAHRDIKSEHGHVETVLNAATLFLQNSLGLVCDPVSGFVELPCISRNASAAPQAFISADLALAGWRSPISFYDTILAMKDVGDKMAPELRCTSLGGLASRPCKV